MQYIYAGFWIRCGAAIIDAILLGIFISIVSVIGVMIGFSYNAEITEALIADALMSDNAFFVGAFFTSFFVEAFSTSGNAFFFTLQYILPFIGTVFFWCRWQATPGKMLLNLAVVDAKTGEDLSVWKAIGRYLGYIPAYLIFFLGIIWIGIDQKKQGWHDKLAGTIVIIKPESLD